MTTLRQISLQTARRLAVASQYLDAQPHPMLDTIRQLGCLQLDPTKAIIQNQYLVLWSRLGHYALADFDRLMWEERQLFEYWAHAASIVLTEHYPIHRRQMRTYIESNRARGEWVKENQHLHDYLLATLRERGAMQLKEFEGNDLVQVDWRSSGWNGGRNIDRMMNHLWTAGLVMVAGRLKGGFRLWDLAERVLPAWTPQAEVDDDDVVRQSIMIAINAQGITTPKHIKYHFVRSEYPNLQKHLNELEKRGQVERVQIVDNGTELVGNWYINNPALLERIENGEWTPRLTLLSPFDNLICDRDRTEQLFDFFFRLEIYVPKDKRQYGYFVTPILDGERLVGRVDPTFDRKRNTLVVHAVHWESTPTAEQVQGVHQHIEQLASWLGASAVEVQ